MSEIIQERRKPLSLQCSVRNTTRILKICAPEVCLYTCKKYLVNFNWIQYKPGVRTAVSEIENQGNIDKKQQDEEKKQKDDEKKQRDKEKSQEDEDKKVYQQFFITWLVNSHFS